MREGKGKRLRKKINQWDVRRRSEISNYEVMNEATGMLCARRKWQATEEGRGKKGRKIGGSKENAGSGNQVDGVRECSNKQMAANGLTIKELYGGAGKLV